MSFYKVIAEKTSKNSKSNRIIYQEKLKKILVGIKSDKGCQWKRGEIKNCHYWQQDSIGSTWILEKGYGGIGMAVPQQ